MRDGHRHCGSGGSVIIDAVIQTTELDTRDIPQADDLASLAGFDDDLLELLLLAESSKGANIQLEGVAGGHRRLSNRPCCDLNILLSQGRDNVVRRHVEVRKLVGIKPDAHTVFPRTEEPDFPNSLDAA